jgi:peptidylprolyl isomerase
MRRLVSILAAVALTGATKAPSPWRPLDPAQTLVIETTKGRIVVALAPQLAPLAVERVKRLAREGVYDGLQFHRVIEGFLGAVPIAGVSAAEQALGSDHRLRVWGAYCDGVAGMGRQAGIDTANSEIFFMRAPSRRLDHDYAVWGRVVQGLDVVRAIKVGEPPKDPDRMLKVRLAADLPPAERPRIEMLDPASAEFRARLAKIRAARGAAFTICDASVPVRVR